MKTVNCKYVFTTVFLSFVSLNLAVAQPTFERVNSLEQALISAAEQELVTKIENRPTTKSFTLVRVSNLKQLKTAGSVRLPINSTTHRFDRKRVRGDNDGGFTWTGTASEPHQETYLFFNDGYLHGKVHLDSVAYNIEPINREIVVFTKLDPASFDKCPLDEQKDSGESGRKNKNNNKEKSSSGSMQTMSSHTVIDVMVVYTPESAAASGNIESLVNASIQSANETLTNSTIDAEVNLVHSDQVNYNETGNMVTDRDRLIATNDGYMDNIHNWRNQYGADIVVLLTETGQYCGLAADIHVSASEAFAVSRNDCSVGNYTFAHEIGHLVGGRHDTDGNNQPLPYAHGFRYEPAYWRTVMAVPNFQGDPVNRIAYWSNPDQTYGGVPMGTTDWNDNVRVWEDRAVTVSDFRSLAPAAPTNLVITNQSETVGDFNNPNLDWDDNTESDLSHYQVFRKYHTTTSSGYQNIGEPTSSQFTDWETDMDTGADEVSYYVKAVNTVGQISNKSNTVWTTGHTLNQKIIAGAISPDKPEEFMLANNYPNPFNPATTIRYALPEQAEVRLDVYNILGRRVATLVNGSQSANFYEVRFDGQGLASGLYIARLQAAGQSGQQFVKELKMQMIK